MLMYLIQKYKPSSEYPGLDIFAHIHDEMSNDDMWSVVHELDALGIYPHDPRSLRNTVDEIGMLKQGLVEEGILFDGFDKDYKLLRPFLALGCLKLSRCMMDPTGSNYPYPDEPYGHFVREVLADVKATMAAL